MWVLALRKVAVGAKKSACVVQHCVFALVTADKVVEHSKQRILHLTMTRLFAKQSHGSACANCMNEWLMLNNTSDVNTDSERD